MIYSFVWTHTDPLKCVLLAKAYPVMNEMLWKSSRCFASEEVKYVFHQGFCVVFLVIYRTCERPKRASLSQKRWRTVHAVKPARSSTVGRQALRRSSKDFCGVGSITSGVIHVSINFYLVLCLFSIKFGDLWHRLAFTRHADNWMLLKGWVLLISAAAADGGELKSLVSFLLLRFFKRFFFFFSKAQSEDQCLWT